MSKLFQFIANHWVMVSLFVIAFIWLIIEESRHQASGSGKRQSPQGVTHLINNEKAVVLDIRDQEAYKSGHLTKAINIALDDIEKSSKRLEKYKKRPIIITCDRGQKSSLAMNKLRKLGFTHLYILSGGISAWNSAGFPLVKGGKNGKD